LARGNEQAALAQKPGRVYAADMATVCGPRPVCLCIDHPHLAVAACCNERLAIRTESEGEDGVWEAQFLSFLLSCGDIPAFHGAIEATGEQPPAIRCKTERSCYLAVRLPRPQFAAGGNLPDAYGLVVAVADDLLAIGTEQDQPGRFLVAQECLFRLP